MYIELPKQCSSRIVKRFAWYPIEAGNLCSFLQICYIRQYYDTIKGWHNSHFVCKEDYLKFKNKHVAFEGGL